MKREGEEEGKIMHRMIMMKDDEDESWMDEDDSSWDIYQEGRMIARGKGRLERSNQKRVRICSGGYGQERPHSAPGAYEGNLRPHPAEQARRPPCAGYWS
jgi:hypothetical protein